MNAGERAMWARLWKLPQAAMWAELHQEYEVALYVRRFLEAAVRDAPAARSTIARQFADSLGLTTPGMRANRWRIVAAETESARTTSSVRGRLRVVTEDVPTDDTGPTR